MKEFLLMVSVVPSSFIFMVASSVPEESGSLPSSGSVSPHMM